VKTKAFTATVTLGLFGAILLCLWRITRGVGTQTEALLLSVILTIVSILISWIVANYYANYSYDENLRVFALKAAEKVTNLSNELARLSAFLRQELESTEYDSPREELLHRDARIEAAIHIINTLKSVNDRSLSDWQGVIGDEISAQREVQEQREEHLRELIERVESLPSQREEDTPQQEDETSGLRSEVESIRRDLRVLATQVGGVPVRSATKEQRQKIQKECPTCQKTVNYQQRPKPESFKYVKCKNCGAKLFSRYSNGEFSLQVWADQEMPFTCPSCSQRTAALVNPVPGSHQIVACSRCDATLAITRTSSGISVKSAAGVSAQVNRSVDEELLQQVTAAMPPQPWPSGTAKSVGRQLGLNPSTMAEAITELTRRRVFKVQVNGQLYVPEKEAGVPSTST